METHYYNVEVNWKAGRISELNSPELDIVAPSVIEVASPPQFPKGVDGVWSPEHLFTAAVSSCYVTSFLAIADNSNLNFESFVCESKGKLELIDGKLIMSEVHLFPSIVILSEDDRQKTIRLMNKAETVCLISNSIKSKVYLTSTVTVKNT